jgi:hypothetical protein
MCQAASWAGAPRQQHQPQGGRGSTKLRPGCSELVEGAGPGPQQMLYICGLWTH